MAGVLALLARRWKLLAAAGALLLVAALAAVVLERRSQEESTPRLFDLTPTQLRNLRTHVPAYPAPNVLDGLRTARLKLLLTRECRLAQESAGADGRIDAVDGWRIREACGFGPLQLDPSVRRTDARRS